MAYARLNATTYRITNQLAQQVAREFECDYIEPEHVLLAIVRDQKNLAAEWLARNGATEARLSKALKAALLSSSEDTWALGLLPGTARCRNLLAWAIDEAVELKSPEIGPEHLLLALLREEEGPVCRALAELGIECRKARGALMEEAQLASVAG